MSPREALALTSENDFGTMYRSGAGRTSPTIFVSDVKMVLTIFT
jgi:hypothetical protein